jgi:hypothetical protein
VENTELNISTETTTAKPTKKVEQTKDGIELKSLLQYQKELKKELDPSFFEREPSRIKYMVGWVAVIAAGLYFAKDAHIVIQLLVGWIIGLGLGANAFIGPRSSSWGYLSKIESFKILLVMLDFYHL